MELVSRTFFFDWEVALMVWLQSHLGGFGTAVASFLSMFGESLASVVVLGFIYWCVDKKAGKSVGITVLLGCVFNPMLKNIALRRRPYMDHADIQCLKPVEKDADLMDIAAQGYSFPSGHSCNSAAMYPAAALYDSKKRKWLRIAAVVIPLLCGISRFCLGVHYPTDVLCGWALGIGLVFLVPFVRGKVKNDNVFMLGAVIISAFGMIWCRSNDYFTSFGMLIGFAVGCPFEEKYVRFENTRSPWRAILRVAGGAAIYFGLNTLLKLPFSSEFLESGTAGAYAVRTVRYAIIMFVDIGLYPMLFKKTAAAETDAEEGSPAEA